MAERRLLALRHPAPLMPPALHRLLLLLALLIAAPLRAQTLEVIELRHRSADEILPIVRPLLEPDGVLTGTNFQLLVRTNPANLAQIRAAVAAVDRAPRALRITVGQGTLESASSAAVRGGVSAGSDNVRVGVNRPPSAPNGATVQADARNSSGQVGNVSSVQTLEGSETWISLGTSFPVRTTEVVPGRPGTVRRTTSFQNASTGFFATARVNGEQVTLEISPQQQRVRPGSGGVIQSASATTTVTGRLGQWIQVGAVQESGSGADSGLLVWGRHTSSSQYSARVMVEAVP